jgi:hypothetical protein
VPVYHQQEAQGIADVWVVIHNQNRLGRQRIPLSGQNERSTMR